MGSGLCARLWAELRRLWARGSGARNPFSAILAASNPSNPSNPLNLANGSAILAVRWRRSKTSHLLDCGLWALCETVGGVAQTVGSGLWRAKSFFSSGPKPLEPCQWFCHTGRLKPLKPLEPCQWFCHTGRWRRSKTSHLLDCGPWALCAGRWRRSKTSHLLDCGRWALCETVGGVAQTVGSGLWPAKSFFSSGPKLPFKPLKPLEPCQWFCHYTGRLKPLKPLEPCQLVLPYWPLETLQNLALARLWALGSVRWPLETLQNLALARLWVLGSVRDCGRSCADCGLGARQILIF